MYMSVVRILPHTHLCDAKQALELTPLENGGLYFTETSRIETHGLDTKIT